MQSDTSKKVRQVLVATDLSAPADEAIRQAHAWATRSAGELLVCHVIPARHRANPLFPHRNEPDALSTVELESRVAELVATRVTEITGRQPDAFRIVIDVGRPEAGIIRAADTANVDLLVIGSRGDTGIERILLGGVSERVVRYAHCSVLVARPALTSGTVMASTDLSDPSFPAISVGASAARSRGARFIVHHNVDLWPLPVPSVGMAFGSSGLLPDSALAVEQRERATRELRDALARADAEAETVVTSGAPDAAILATVEKQKPELLVIGTHGRTGLARIALGSVAERVVAAANCSVLVVRLEK
jgi:nucleotide-binding universal stress UspA family protein